MTVLELIEKLEKVENKHLEVEFACPSLAEEEIVGLVAEFRDCILLCTNDMCDSDVDFID
ncbi:MAG: hypothetical protein ACRCX7_12610 [Cetobacterium sp.]|uniref:hypothetical protein n=1 Tax=Cetobacterium sp. TaxID=2071632 RepID=UPI003F3CF368